MNKIELKSLVLLCFTVPGFAGAADGGSAADEVLATRGKGVVTQAAFDAQVWRIPEESRQEVLRDRGRVTDLINELLLRAQLAADARESGFEQDPEIQARMKLAVEEELARAWIEEYANRQGEADYEQLARESYTLEKEKFRSQETVDVSHILIKDEERGEDAAEALALEVLALLRAKPERFDELALEYSEDSRRSSNNGRYREVSRGQLVKPFEKAAFSMQPGEISDPVRTQYGFHIIRLDAISAPQQRTFEEVHDALVERERTRHRDRITNDYLSYLSSMNVEMTEQALETMVRRHFGEAAVGDSE